MPAADRDDAVRFADREGGGVLKLSCAAERFPIAGRFVISRGAKTEAEVVVVTITDGHVTGRGECVPYTRYGESVASVLTAIGGVQNAVERSPDRGALQGLLPAGAARNAIDCALWDFEAKRDGVPAHRLAGLPAPSPVTTAFTISLDEPDAMAEAARRAAERPLLKIKLGGARDDGRIRAVRAAVPAATLIVDANEAWSPEQLGPMMAVCAEAGVALVEQPLPAGHDAPLADLPRLVPVCADESLHDRDDIPGLRGRYDAVNIKLDKAGGLTEALAVAAAARAAGLDIMVGCMVGTSLAMAPALLLASQARFVDLDGPLLLARDREGGLHYDGSRVGGLLPSLWG